MWIQKPESLRVIKHPEMDGRVELGEGETCQVTQEMGEQLIEYYDDIEEHNSEE